MGQVNKIFLEKGIDNFDITVLYWCYKNNILTFEVRYE